MVPEHSLVEIDGFPFFLSGMRGKSYEPDVCISYVAMIYETIWDVLAGIPARQLI